MMAGTMVHPTAIIDHSSSIDPTAQVGPYAVIGPRVVLKAGVVVHPHAVIEYAEIGANCVIFSGASVGSAPQDLKYRNEPTRIVIGDGTVVREFCTLNRATAASGTTIIGSRCLFMAYAHVAHDCRIGNEVIVANSVAVAGHVEIGDNAVLGGLVGIHQFVRIGRCAMIGAGSMVPLDVAPFVVGAGDRMKLVGINVLGLRRRGFTPDTVRAVQNAYRMIFMSGMALAEALSQVEAAAPPAEVLELTQFLKASKRGITRARSGGQSSDEER